MEAQIQGSVGCSRGQVKSRIRHSAHEVWMILMIHDATLLPPPQCVPPNWPASSARLSVWLDIEQGALPKVRQDKIMGRAASTAPL